MRQDPNPGPSDSRACAPGPPDRSVLCRRAQGRSGSLPRFSPPGCRVSRAQPTSSNRLFCPTFSVTLIQNFKSRDFPGRSNGSNVGGCVGILVRGTESHKPSQHRPKKKKTILNQDKERKGNTPILPWQSREINDPSHPMVRVPQQGSESGVQGEGLWRAIPAPLLVHLPTPIRPSAVSLTSLQAWVSPA